MADNVEITSGTGTTVAADEVTRNAVLEKQQIIKLSLGADGAFDTLVDSGQQSMANSVPIVIASDQTAVPVSLSSAPLPTGAATSANQTTQITAEQAIQASVQIMDDWDDGADSAKVVGNVASEDPDSGSPVKIGGVYTNSLPTLSIGDRTNLYTGTRGSLHTELYAPNSTNPVAVGIDNTDNIAASSTSDKIVTIARNTVYDGTQWDLMRGDQTDGLLVNLGGNNDVTVASGSITADTELTTADLDTGAGTDTRAVVGLVGSASGGGQLIPGSATDGLLVNLGANNDVTVTGSVTANAGTNLNTSLLALESGGNLATAVASLSVLDDWDETDRAKVNIIAGQVAITAGAGAVAANTPRITLASDDPGITSLQLIDDVVITDDTSTHTPATTKALNIAFVADETSSDSVNEGDLGMARMSLERFVVTTPRPTSTGEGYDIANNIDVDESEDAVKTGAGKLYGWFWYNDGAAEVYVKYYNDTVANVIVGTTAPTITIGVPAGGATNIEWSNGIPFSAAITVAATTASTTADTGAPATNQVVGFSLYK